uniref:Uncharacterized protein n=1 Tax=Cannabis sativa TaxID=3483 RepID=A0A803NKZ7_CANSA
MALTRTKSGLCFIGSSTRAGDSSDPQEVTSHHKSHQGEDQNLDAVIVEDSKSRESSSEDIEVNTNYTPEDMNEDELEDNTGKKSQPNESDPMVIMARQLQLDESKLTGRINSTSC